MNKLQFTEHNYLEISFVIILTTLLIVEILIDAIAYVFKC